MSQVSAAHITPECRSRRGDEGAWDEAVARLREHYDAVVEGWRGASVGQPTLHLVLTMDRPNAAAAPLNLTAEQFEAARDAGEVPRTSFMCSGDDHLHAKCRGTFLNAQVDREPCRCPAHGGQSGDAHDDE